MDRRRHNDHVGRILAQTKVLLLDFDGPICSVFAGLPAPEVANRLRNALDHDALPHEVSTTDDPFDVLFYASTLGSFEAQRIEKILSGNEVEAVHSAEPTAGSHDLIEVWKSTGRPLVIVSNNSEAAVVAYLALHSLNGLIDLVAARTTANFALLKPNPHLVTKAVQGCQAQASACTLAGDSSTDIEAAHAGGVRCIAYANKPGKAEQFGPMNPVAIVTELTTLM